MSQDHQKGEEDSLEILTKKLKRHLTEKKSLYASRVLLSEDEILTLSKVGFKDFKKLIALPISEGLISDIIIHNISISDRSYIANKILTLSSKELDKIKAIIVRYGYYNSDVKIQDLYESFDKKAKIELILISDHSVAKKAISDKDPDVRLVAFQKLGFLQILSKMLEDPVAGIRKRATEIIPSGDERLESLVLEKSKYVFEDIVRKIDRKNLPLLLANRNIEDSLIKYFFNKRMNELE